MLFVNFLKYLVITVPLMVVAVWLFTRTTPYNEFKIMFDGDVLEDKKKVAASKAVAFDLGGKIIGLSLLLASAVYHSISLWDLAAWGLVGTVFLIGVYWLFELLTPGITVRKEIPNGNVAVGIFSFCLSIASGLLLGSLISY